MRVRRTVFAAVAVAGTVLTVTGSVLADSNMQITAGEMLFRNPDAGIANDLIVDTDSRGRARFIDEADPFGIKYPTECTPGKVNGSGNVVEVFCDKTKFTGVGVDLGPGEDSVTYKLDDKPSTLEGNVGGDKLTGAGAVDQLFGGQGNDVLDGGAGDDTVRGDEGDDTLRGGPGNDKIDAMDGFDTVDGGEGDDTIRGADGFADKIECGAGNDTVFADTADEVLNCETVNRSQVAAPAGAAPKAPDHTRPRLQLGGSTYQRVGGKARSIAIAITVNEPARIDVSGFLAAGGINDALKARVSRVTVGGGGTTVRVVLSAKQLRRVLSDLRRGRRPSARVTVSAVDAAGNTSSARHLTVALRRR